MSNKKVRVRFAPSPTGFLHIGGARTALFNWLFARKMDGTFILRIEDTDELRSTEESVGVILRDLSWLGLDWDEGPERGGEYGPYFQMQRLELYREFAQRLYKEGRAYYCYCTREELAQRREEALKRGEPPGYDGRCRNLTDAQRAQFEAEGREPVLRFRTPDEGETSFYDLVRGEVKFLNALIDDFVILKSNGTPTFLFANTVDDHFMEITHVIRGDEHLSNTPRQLMLYEALGWEAPEFAHLSMILGTDGRKLSKRHGAVAVSWYREQGYLPFALVNYIALLGWSTKDSQQIFESIEELIEKFSIHRVSKNPAIFDPKKLEWMNAQHIRMTPTPQLAEMLKPFLEQAGLMDGVRNEEWFHNVIDCLKERFSTLSEFPHQAEFFLKRDIEYDEDAWAKIMTKPGVAEILRRVREVLAELDDFSVESVEQACRGLIDELGIKGGALIHPLRVAVTGRRIGPGVFHCVSFAGKEWTLERIDRAIKKLQENA